jgi:hypothetical protein
MKDWDDPSEIPMGTGAFRFQPIAVNAKAPGGACVLRTFDDIGAFILNKVDVPCRLSPHGVAVRLDLKHGSAQHAR